MTIATDDLRALVRQRLDGRPDSWLARRLGVSQQHLSRVLLGTRPASQQLLERILTYARTGELPPCPSPSA